MSISAAMTWFFSTAALIFAPFALVEKLPSKEDLENYYLLMTVKRGKFSAQWYLLLITFIDSTFGFYKVYGRVMAPSVIRVGAYTVCTTAVIWLLLYGRNFRFRSFAVDYSLALLSNFLFDYFNFLKTRKFVAKRRTFNSILFGIFLELISLILVYIVSTFIGIVILVSFAVGHVATVATIKKFLIITGISPAIIITQTMPNIFAASLSTIIIILFVAATIASHFANNISVVQEFLFWKNRFRYLGPWSWFYLRCYFGLGTDFTDWWGRTNARAAWAGLVRIWRPKAVLHDGGYVAPHPPDARGDPSSR